MIALKTPAKEKNKIDLPVLVSIIALNVGSAHMTAYGMVHNTNSELQYNPNLNVSLLAASMF
jgi:hypothetical protein